MVSIMPENGFETVFLHTLLDDLSLVNGIKNTLLDKDTIQKRVAHEGFSFLAKTLPKMGSALDSALKTGVFECPTEFRRHKHTALPCFTKGLLLRIFTFSGVLMEEPDLAAIAELRQLYYSFYKTETDFTKKQLSEAELKFKDTDADLLQEGFSADLTSEAHAVMVLAREFLTSLFRGFDPYDINPCHGPGIVASGEKPHEKRIFGIHYKEIHEQYPYYRWFYINTYHLDHCVHEYRDRPRKEVGTNKVLFVPKDSRGPRTIACEPLEYMYLQQGLRKAIYQHVEASPLTRGRINFTDQSVNQKLAYKASLGQTTNVTVDLKDASDRVSNTLVQELFKNTPLAKPLRALRTPFSKLPSGEVVALNKYAAMGSALCFPIEALVFYALLVGVNSLHDSVAHPVYVYGDDIICDVNIYDKLVSIFEEFKLRVNLKKCSTTGFFRESCGAEYYKGNDVTYLKVRTVKTSSPEHVVTLVNLSNSLFERGYYNTAEYVRSYVNKHVSYSIPDGQRNSPYLNYNTVRTSYPYLCYKGARYNAKLQRYEVKRPVLKGLDYQVSADSLYERYAEYSRKLTQGWSENFVSGCYAKRGVKLLKKYVQLGM